MTLISALSRKRRPSSPLPPSSARWANQPLSKIPKLNHLFDGTGSRSMESTSTGRSKLSVKSQLKRGVSSIKTVLGIGDRCSDGSVQHRTESLFPLTQGSRSVYLLANDSNTTTIHQPLRIRLTAIADDSEDDRDTSASPTVKSAPITPGTHGNPENGDAYDSLGATDNGKEILRSQSAPGLQRRISQKFQQAFGNGNSTVVKRADLRSRPSIQTLLWESAVANSTPFSSTPSTLNSGTFSPIDRNASTLPSSDPVTPLSIVHRESMDLTDIDRQTFMGEGRLLSPIPEGISPPCLTIKTVEAAATTKMYFELHFNSLFHGTSPRIIRRRELEKRLRELHLPADIRDRVRAAWEMAKSENLRQRRALKNTTNQAKASQGVSVGGFEVISILGKGSFGVVRLVKAKGSQNTLHIPEAKGLDKMLLNAPSRASMKTSSKVLSGGLLNKRGDPTKARKEVFAMKVIRKSDMIRNGQEGHLRAERDFLVAAEGSKWVIPLIAAFQDRKHLYLVMEYCIGGDFLGLLIRKNVLSEEFTKFYIAEMILCVEEAHRMKWIHRDVKPDNFLIAFDGHLKISDFGLAFDGDWSHDQRFYQKNRHSLLDELGISVDGDEQDQQEKEAQSHHATRKHGKDDSMYKEEPALGEPILDWRNRSQRRRLARSVVGTSQYMAPEVIRGEMYDGRCD
ncbi:AGC/NDR protein kinase [Cladophialophora psammophila CBS 110553]|uniref:non-specific serine/threonine protein kinase n=1 Tax=Cladophialophora psammophila CBS 110553 TaxID=1182543 RepID=W9X6Y0_9EURO|nr:AGC/NDR protein kinase [Cladophialophora psammophila CBS 110553]EXJ76232.1 AGC/NDR protein kinase [Cladophialophora psammophila CBS 110553]